MNPKREVKPNANQKSEPQVRRNVRNLTQFSWNDCADNDILRSIRLCAAAGAAIMFGVTSDGGAGSVCILAGNDKIKEYPHTAEEFADLVEWLAKTYFD